MSNGRNSEGYPDPTPYEAERNIEYERRQQGRRAKYAGERFENMISAACNYYRSQNIADIEKTPEPMRPLKPYGDRRRGQYVAVFTKKAQNDYKGNSTAAGALPSRPNIQTLTRSKPLP